MTPSHAPHLHTHYLLAKADAQRMATLLADIGTVLLAHGVPVNGIWNLPKIIDDALRSKENAK